MSLTETPPFLLLDCEEIRWAEKFACKKFASLEHAIEFLEQLANAEDEPLSSSQSSIGSSEVHSLSHSLSTSGLVTMFDSSVTQVGAAWLVVVFRVDQICSGCCRGQRCVGAKVRSSVCDSGRPRFGAILFFSAKLSDNARRSQLD